MGEWDSSVDRALWDSGIAQWREYYRRVRQLSRYRSMGGGGMAQWLEHYGRMGLLSR